MAVKHPEGKKHHRKIDDKSDVVVVKHVRPDGVLVYDVGSILRTRSALHHFKVLRRSPIKNKKAEHEV